MLTPDQLDVVSARLRRKYVISIHHDLSGRRLRPYWAILTHGVMVVGEPGAGIWRARSEERLIAKCERWIKRNALSEGITDPSIEVERR
jgi:hypothetical protein